MGIPKMEILLFCCWKSSLLSLDQTTSIFWYQTLNLKQFAFEAKMSGFELSLSLLSVKQNNKTKSKEKRRIEYNRKKKKKEEE